MSNYSANFGLEYDPFIKNNSNNTIIKTKEMIEAEMRLDFLKDIHGFGLLTGQPGLGKTTTIKKWSEGLNKNLYKVVYITLTTLTTMEFYRELAYQLNCEPMHRKVDNFHNIQNEITRLVVEKKITPVIIIDEANYISAPILNDLKMIFNFDMDSKERAIILLVGLPQINTILTRVANEPLRQRIVMNYHMESLDYNSSKEYIETKIKKAGGSVDLIEGASMTAIISATGGVPRLIDQLCSRCLIIANTKKEVRITPETVMGAKNDITI